MTNVNTEVIEITPKGGATLNGYKLGWLYAANKVAANDTITIKNAVSIDRALLQIKATGVAEGNTLSTNVITCTETTSGSPITGLIIYR